MKTTFFAFLFFFSFTSLHAQIGIYTDYLSQAQTSDWTNANPNNTIDFIGSGIEAGVNYQIKFRDIRIELRPGLAYSQQQQDFSLAGIATSTKVSAIQAEVGARIYPLDLEGDCDCPTWRKEGPTLEKGLYFELASGMSRYDFEVEQKDLSTYNSNSLAWFITGGIGFDIGINDLLTITPQASLRYYPGVEWETLNKIDALTTTPLDSELIQYSFGIQLGFNY